MLALGAGGRRSCSLCSSVSVGAVRVVRVGLIGWLSRGVRADGSDRRWTACGARRRYRRPPPGEQRRGGAGHFGGFRMRQPAEVVIGDSFALALGEPGDGLPDVGGLRVVRARGIRKRIGRDRLPGGRADDVDALVAGDTHQPTWTLVPGGRSATRETRRGRSPTMRRRRPDQRPGPRGRRAARWVHASARRSRRVGRVASPSSRLTVDGCEATSRHPRQCCGVSLFVEQSVRLVSFTGGNAALHHPQPFRRGWRVVGGPA